jgi:hypothetical protein
MFWIAAAVSVEMGGPSKTVTFSRLEMGPGVCFVGVTSISNRKPSRLEIWGPFVCFVGVTPGVDPTDSRLEIAVGSRS